MKQVINILKLKTDQEISQVANHNLRQVPSRNVVKSRTPNNKFFVGSPNTNTILEMEERLKNVPKFRKDAVKIVDLVLSASPEFFEDKKKTKEWELATQKWTEDTFGKDNIIYSVVHYDEKTPHFHICFTPIFEGKLRASHWFDGPLKLKKIHDSYNKAIKSLGISRGQKSVKSSQTELDEYYKKVNSSTAYDRQLDKKLDDLFTQLDNPNFSQKLNPWSLVENVVKPLMTQLARNLSHYRTKAKAATQDKKDLVESRQKVQDLELKFETLGLGNNPSFLMIDSIKAKLDILEEKKMDTKGEVLTLDTTQTLTIQPKSSIPTRSIKIH